MWTSECDNKVEREYQMKLIESKQYINDLEKAMKNIDLSGLDGKSIFITGGLGLICSAIVDVLYVMERPIFVLEQEMSSDFRNVSAVVTG